MKYGRCLKKHNQDECATAVSSCLFYGEGNDGGVFLKEAQFLVLLAVSQDSELVIIQIAHYRL